MIGCVVRQVWCGLLIVTGGAVQAETVTLIGENGFLQNRGQLFVMNDAPPQTREAGTGSLFAGARSGSLFAPYPQRHVARGVPALSGGGSEVVQLRQLISAAESRLHGYDAVQHGARIRPDKPPTQMTLGEIFDWIDATPGQPHAIGRYQFVPATLRRVAARAGAGEGDLFSPALQDRLSDELLSDAGFAAFQRGELARHAFMNNLAKIWAGLPNDTGKSHYDGYAGNKAAISWDDFDAAMMRIFEG